MRMPSFVLALAALTLACNDPFVLLPGGRLGGETHPAPPGFAFAESSGTAQLETRPQDPYSVNIVYTVLDGRLYVNAGDTESTWVKHMQADPNVRLRVDGVVYDLRAERVTDRNEIVAFGKAWTSQSAFRRDPASFDQVFVYRLVPR